MDEWQIQTPNGRTGGDTTVMELARCMSDEEPSGVPFSSKYFAKARRADRFNLVGDEVTSCSVLVIEEDTHP
jgi:hypothetical protein